nr:hypothetical protein [Tanacetum cinerariifolium]
LPIQNGKTLRVIGEKPEEKVRHLRSAKAKEEKKRKLSWLETFSRGQGCRNNDNRLHGGAFMLRVEEAHQDPNIVMGIESSSLVFGYEIEIASGQLVEIDKVIKGMYWLSKHKAKIICHEKVVRLPIQNGKTLRVIGEKPEEKVRHLRSAKAKEEKKRKLSWLETFS